MIKLTEFKGEVEVMGAPRHVSFAEGTLSIAGLTAEESTRFLGFFFSNVTGEKETGAAKVGLAVDGAALASAAGKGDEPRTRKRAPAAAASEAPKADSKQTELPAVPAQPAAQVPKEEPKAAETPKPEESKPAALEPVESPASAAKPEPAAAPPAEGKAEPPKGGWDLAGDAKGDDGDERVSLDGELDAALVGAKRMRDVVVWLQEHGVTVEAQLVAACEKIKDRVPVLSRVQDIADRVKRTLEVMGYER